MTKALAQSAIHRMLNGVVQKKSSHSETRTGGAVVRPSKTPSDTNNGLASTNRAKKQHPRRDSNPPLRQYQPNTTWAPTQIGFVALAFKRVGFEPTRASRPCCSPMLRRQRSFVVKHSQRSAEKTSHRTLKRREAGLAHNREFDARIRHFVCVDEL